MVVMGPSSISSNMADVMRVTNNLLMEKVIFCLIRLSVRLLLS